MKNKNIFLLLFITLCTEIIDPTVSDNTKIVINNKSTLDPKPAVNLVITNDISEYQDGLGSVNKIISAI